MTTPTVIAALIDAANEIERLGGDPSRFHIVVFEAPDVLGALMALEDVASFTGIADAGERRLMAATLSRARSVIARATQAGQDPA